MRLDQGASIIELAGAQWFQPETNTQPDLAGAVIAAARSAEAKPVGLRQLEHLLIPDGTAGIYAGDKDLPQSVHAGGPCLQATASVGVCAHAPSSLDNGGFRRSGRCC